MKKRAQAAMEFLMTYGWAILVVLVAIGALAYFGVLDPGKFLPQRCVLPSGLHCEDFVIVSGGAAVRIKNVLGYTITLDKVSLESCGVYQSPLTLINGESTAVNVPCSPALTGTKYSGQLNVTYTNTETNLQHKAQGSLR